MIKGKKLVNQVFDKVFIINLPKYTTRRIRTVAQLKSWGIACEVVEAVFGYDETHKAKFEQYATRAPGDIDDAEYREIEIRQNRKLIESPGAWGYLLTFEKILAKAVDQKLKRILVFDDDVIFHYDFENEFSRFINCIKEDWKVVQLGASQYGWEAPRIKKVGDSFYPYYTPAKIGTCGSFAVGIDQSVFKEMLEEVRTMRSAFDNLPLGNIYKNYPNDCYVAFPNIVVPDVSESIIRGGRDQFSQSAIMRWPLENFPVFDGLPTITVLCYVHDEKALIQKITLLERQDYAKYNLVFTSNNTLNLAGLVDEYKYTMVTYQSSLSETYLKEVAAFSGDYVLLLDDLSAVGSEDFITSQLDQFLQNESTAAFTFIEKNKAKDYCARHQTFVTLYNKLSEEKRELEAQLAKQKSN